MLLRFYTLDVFTDEVFGGNGLGVFPDSAHLPPDLMQRIAREMNLSESVFLGPPEVDGDARVRIFTPGVEVPFAGHPTVGTAIFLASEREDTPNDGVLRLVLEENVGPVPVEVQMHAGHPVSATFTTAQPAEHRPSPWSTGDLARMVGLDPDDISNELPCEMVSCGLPYHIVPVRTSDAVRRAVLDMARWKAMLAESWAHHVYLVCVDPDDGDAHVHVRMFAPGSGVPEDPATGSAAAALGGYLSAADGRADGRLGWTVTQGTEMGRPSVIQVEADRAGDRTTSIRVGGKAVFVSEGTMRVPGTSRG